MNNKGMIYMENVKPTRKELYALGYINLDLAESYDYSFLVHRVKTDFFKIPYKLFGKNLTAYLIKEDLFKLAQKLLHSQDITKNKMPNILKLMHICGFEICAEKNQNYTIDINVISTTYSEYALNEYLNKIELTCCKYLK